MRMPGKTAGFRWMLRALLAVAIPFLLLDATWLTLMGDRLYRPTIGHLMRPGFDAVAALAFYALYLPGIVGFAVRPANCSHSALLRGACFGLVCYATYDLTNQATLAGWPWRLTLLDLAWGMFATGASAWLAYRFSTASTASLTSNRARDRATH